MQCYNCKVALPDGSTYCPRCGATFVAPQPTVNYVQYVQYQTPQYQVPPTPLKSRFAYVVLAILFGGLGIHNFYAGRSGCGTAQLLLSLFTCVGGFPIWIWALIEALVVKNDGLDREMKTMSTFEVVFSIVLFLIVFFLPMIIFFMFIGALQAAFSS